MNIDLVMVLQILGLFGVTFGQVAIKVVQQLNVVHGHYKRAFVTSYIFSAFDGVAIGVYANATMNGVWWHFLVLGSGSALGGLLAMWLYHRKKGSP
jgi:uncharacterized membrane protein YfcA